MTALECLEKLVKNKISDISICPRVNPEIFRVEASTNLSRSRFNDVDVTVRDEKDNVSITITFATFIIKQTIEKYTKEYELLIELYRIVKEYILNKDKQDFFDYINS